MKHIRIVLLLPLLLALCACSRLSRDDYRSVEPHVEQTVAAEQPTQEEQPTVVTNRNELRGAVLSFIRNWTEHGTIFVQNYSGAIESDLSETMSYVTAEDPVGAYAVDYADAELTGDAQSGSIELSIVFRRSAAEIDSIVTVNDNLVAEEMIHRALQNYDTALTLRIRNYTETDFVTDIRSYCLEHPQEAGALPTFSATLYPREGETRILELHFEYAYSKDEMRLMQDSVETILRSAATYVRAGQTEREQTELLARFLLMRFSYTVGATEPSMPAYDLLVNGVAHSLSFSSVFFAECSSADVECVMVSGTKDGAVRYWNIVKIEDTYYHVDLMRSVELGERELVLLRDEAMQEEGYSWNAEAYPASPEPTDEPTEPDAPPTTEPPEPTQPPLTEPPETTQPPTALPTEEPTEPSEPTTDAPTEEPTEPPTDEPSELPSQPPEPTDTDEES